MCRKFIFLISFVFVLGFTANSAFGDLVAYYPMNEGTGRIIKDLSGFGHDGEAQADPAWVDGQSGYGTAIYFDGTDPAPAWINCGTWNPSEVTGELSVACWIKWDGINGNWQGIIGKRDGWDAPVGSSAPTMWYLEVSMNGDMKFSSRGESIVDVQFDQIPPEGEWCHLAVSFDGINISQYVDGEEAESYILVGGVRDDAAHFIFGPQTDATITIGCDNLGGANAFFGTIDEVRLYDTALPEEDIEGVMFDTGRNPELAKAPKPKDQITEVARDAIVTWKPGFFAVKHNLYFGTSFADVNQASVDDPRGVMVLHETQDTSYDPDGLLDYGMKYYWRVDEVNDVDPNSPWKGNVWSFTVRAYILVDDFEGYNEYEPNRIFDVWLDYAVNNTGMTVGYFDTPYIEETNIHGGKKAMPLFYDNDGTVNEETDYEQSGVQFYSQVERKWDTPQNWLADVNSLSLWYKGYPAYCGDFVEDPAGTYTIKASGADIWRGADEFHFAYKEVASSACSIIAKVESLEAINNDSKAGIMIRDSLEPDAVNVALLFTPDPEKGLRFQYRNATGSGTVRGDRDLDPNAMPPYWVKLERTYPGGLIRAYRSPDGEEDTWTRFDLKTTSMPMPIYIGLAVTSHDVTQVCEAKFSNVSFPGNDTLASQAWAHCDIGIISNESEPMYVAINGKAVYNEDPNAVLIGQWTKWQIPLQKFSDSGVDLSRANSFSIGLGNKSNPQPGGRGKLYIDDIRLYVPSLQ
jgi:hypothetical protein